MTPRSPAVLLVLGSCASLQAGAALAVRLFPVVGSTGATLLRLGLASAALLLVARPRLRRWDRAQWRVVAVLGVSLAGMNGSFYASLARLPLGTAVTVEFLGPLALAAALSRRVRDVGWVLLAATGVVVLGTGGEVPGGLDPLGVVLALVAGGFWALYVLAGARVGAVVPGLGGLAAAMGVAALVLAPLGAAGAAHAGGRPDVLLLAAGTALLASVVPYSLELAALRRLPPRVFGVLLSLEPAVATTAGWLLLGQRAGLWDAVGVAVVVAASAGSTLSARPAAARPRTRPRPRARPRTRPVPGTEAAPVAGAEAAPVRAGHPAG